MIPRGNGSSKRIAAPRTTISDPESALDHVEELLYVSKDRDTTSDLKRPRAASGSALLTDEVEASPKTHSSTYVYGKPCPEENEDCHYHNQLTQHCHIPWRHCSSALNAIKQSYRTGGERTGAPTDWNKEHEACLKTKNQCDIHAQLREMALEQQRNKKYPEKLRVRGRHSRGSGSQKNEDR